VRYFLQLSYDGSNYYGWQFQPNHISVQQEVENAISTILNTPTKIVGCGRTDAKVHAEKYFAHFEFDGELPVRLKDRLNKYLPDDIAVQKIFEVGSDEHARFGATERTYKYIVSLRKNPILKNRAMMQPFPKLDIELMKKTASIFTEHTDYYCFCASINTYKHHNCKVAKSQLDYNEEKELLTYHVSANRFLHSMVRRLMGTLLLLGRGKITVEDVKNALENREPFKIIRVAEPQGLYLVDIKYPFIK